MNTSHKGTKTPRKTSKSKQFFVALCEIAKRYILAPRPRQLAKCGADTLVYLPRRFEGAHCIEIGDRVKIYRYSWLSAIVQYAGVHYTPRIVIGDDVQIGQYVCITSINQVLIGEGCLLSEYVYLSDSAHGIDPAGGLLAQQKLESKGAVTIGAHSFLGYRACVLSGVTLGKHCVVGANAVVTHSFPDYSMVAGAPARLIKRYSLTEKRWVEI